MASDIVFVHAPSVYDFRKKPIFYGPISDVVPSSPVFEMYPVGFMTMSAHLEEAGYKTRIMNLAVRMLQSKKFNAEKEIKKLDAKVFAIDLHWMPHAHGALEIAKIVKKYHPDSIVEFGGFTSSYFREELIQRPEVDMIMCGDSTEIPHIRLMESIIEGKDLSNVPNLTWKDKNGKVHFNEISFIPEDLDWVKFDYGTVIRNVLRHRDLKSALPWLGWDELPLASVFTVRGCSHNCAECGGSAYANKKVLCRSRPAFRSPEKIAEDMSAIQDYMKAPIFVIGDVRQAGNDYAERMFKAIKERGIKNHVALELFGPANEEFCKMAERALGNYTLEFSPDSHDEKVRYALGKNYDNSSIERTLQNAFRNGCTRFDLFYMTGLPEQTRESAMESVKASKGLWEAVEKKDALFIYNAPFAPFVDPGSRAFEDPERWGYRFFARTLEEHRRLLDNPSWKHVLSYETKWMSRDDIAETSYDAALELARIEHSCGRSSKELYESRAERTVTAKMMLRKIDDILLISDARERESALWDVKEEGEKLMLSTICNKKDLDWETGSVFSNTPRIITGLIRSVFRK
ncbi:MAG: TIGR04190 family B12-binding domain/radical SAM domain protein [Methanomassiliicoccaceae archaeon]|nr:TIGR04190 family B12-binding domain/radical SAM domain protein [Methanomassiliicoccaceae archaeon]